MSFLANVLTVLIASPNDVPDERDIAAQEINLWNAANGVARQLLLSPVRWETHSSPQLGVPAQTGLDEQILATADIVVGIFGTKIGTATAEYISGSVQEIKKHVADGKLAMVYFSRVPVDPNTIDPTQWAALQSFKEECRGGGLYHEYETKEQFKQDLGHHLAIELNKPKYLWLQPPADLAGSSEKADSTLSDIERKLLIAASEDGNGSILQVSTMDGYFLRANGVSFGDNTPRGTAALKRALRRLEELSYISRNNEDVYEISDDGFARADKEIAESKPPQPAVSGKGLELLSAAIAGEGNIMYRNFIGGEGIDAGGKSFMTRNDPRDTAEWREALQELQKKGFITARSKALFNVTAAGYAIADQLNQAPASAES